MKYFWFIIYLLLFLAGVVLIWSPSIFGLTNWSAGDLWPKMIITIILGVAFLLQRFWKD